MKHPIERLLISIMLIWTVTACAGSGAIAGFDRQLVSLGIDPSEVALIVVRLEDGQTWQHGGARVDKRFVAASTSKIPHTFIALEYGYVSGPETMFKWDGLDRRFDSWNQDQTISQAYKRSAVWVYQNIAQTLGPEKMATGIEMFSYGNQDIGGPESVTTYWLNGPLKISAREQVQFLTKLFQEQFPLSINTYAMGKEIMSAGRIDGRSAKTGWYYSELEVDIGWYVGWQAGKSATGQPETFVFAFNMDIRDRDMDPPKRVEVVDAALNAIMAR